MKEIPKLLQEASCPPEIREQEFQEAIEGFSRNLETFLDNNPHTRIEKERWKVWEKALSLDGLGEIFVRLTSYLNNGQHAGLYWINLYRGHEPVDEMFYKRLLISKLGGEQSIRETSSKSMPQGIIIADRIQFEPWEKVLEYIIATT